MESNNTHTIFMEQMSQYLNRCKEKSFSCQCTGVLTHNPNILDPENQWTFLFQCNQTDKSVHAVQDLTRKLIANPYEAKIYQIKKN
jgi:hypothetical protein